jgi:Zn-dependent M28 family amino/carboxypeptidase
VATRRVLHVTTLALAACLPAAPGPTPGRPLFDGDAAMALVRQQVAFGPRVPGTPGHAAQRAWMLARLDSTGASVSVDTFPHVTTEGDSLTLYNIGVRFRTDATRRILLLTHWDTRPTSDEADDSAARATPVPGANDGGSGTAILLELAAMMARTPPPVGVDLLFVDGEDYGPSMEDMFLGARRYAERLDSADRPVYGLLLDLVGDADPRFEIEELSAQAAPVVVRKVWDAAERLGYTQFFPDVVGARVLDDHVILIDAGLPTANLIDFVYGPNNRYWHTPQDTPENVSALTLGMVGEVVTELVYSGG